MSTGFQLHSGTTSTNTIQLPQNTEQILEAFGLLLRFLLRFPQLISIQINIDKLWTLVPQETRDEYINGSKKDTAPVFDLTAFGYGKLCGKGRLPEVPIVVKVRHISKEAEKKVTEAGGKVLLTA